jgi:hypothetical protein
VLTCRIAISFASWLIWFSEREDTRSSTEKDIADGGEEKRGGKKLDTNRNPNSYPNKVIIFKLIRVPVPPLPPSGSIWDLPLVAARLKDSL